MPLLKLRSEQRDSGSIYDFRINRLSQKLCGKYHVRNFYAANTFWNVNSTNNVIYFNDGSAKTATITPGFYTASTLVTAVAAALNVVGTGFSCTLSSLTSAVTISNATPFILSWGTFTTNSAGEILGFSSVDAPAATAQTAPHPVNLDMVQSYNFIIDGCTSGIVDMKSGNGYTFSLPITEDSLSVEHYVPIRCEHVAFVVSEQLSSLHVRVVDDNNKPIQLQHDYYLIIESDASSDC